MATALLTAFFAWLALRVELDPEVLRLLPPDAGDARTISRYAGVAEDIDHLVLVATGEEVFSVSSLEMLESLATRIRSHPAVLGATTPFNLITVTSEAGRIVFGPLSGSGRPPATRNEAAALRRRAVNDPIARRIVVTEDGRSIRLVFPVKVQKQYRDLMTAVEGAIEAAARDAPRSDHIDIRVAGWIPLHETTRSFLEADPPRLVGIAVLVTLLVYLLSFRAPRAALIPVLTVGISLIWTLGLMGLVGVPLSLIGVMIPVLIFALGSSYSIHILSRYYAFARRAAHGSFPDRRTWIVDAVGEVAGTVVLAALTTSVGFASLLSSGLPRVREFGVFTAIGVIICAAVSIALFVALLSRMPSPQEKRSSRSRPDPLARLMRFIGGNASRIAWPLLGAVVALVVMFVWAVPRLRYQTDFSEYYRRDVAAVDDNRFLMERFGSFVDVNLTVAAPPAEPDYFLTVDGMQRARGFEAALKANEDISDVTSFVTYVDAVAAAAGTPPEAVGVPLISFVARLLRSVGLARDVGGENASPTGPANIGALGGSIPLSSADLSQLTFRIWVYDGETKRFLLEEDLRRLVAFIEATAVRLLPAGVSTELWGWNLVALRVSETLRRDQLTSVALSMVIIFIVTSVSLRSFRYGALSLSPIAVGLMASLVIMWAAGIPFDVLTVMFSSVAVGVGVDDSVHLLLEYRRRRAVDGVDGVDDALTAALVSAGRAILITSLAIVVGMLALLFSQFLPVAYFGALIAITLTTTTIGALVILPALVRRTEPPQRQSVESS